jgi:hypothetical protein
VSYFAGQAEYELSFGVNPITLVGGIAGQMPGGTLPLPVLMNGSLISGYDSTLDEAFGKFYPLPGSSLAENQIGEYPFANEIIAANAIIRQPLMVSLLMRCPVRSPAGYAAKLAIMTGLQNTLDAHAASGGTFIVATPSYYYAGCILLGLHDVSAGETLQAQSQWRWDFRRPMISGSGNGSGSMNPFMQGLTNGAAISGAMTGLDLATSETIGSPSVGPAQGSASSTGVPAVSGAPSNVLS